MRAYDLNSKVDFGKHKGQKLKEIIQNDPNYIEWCMLNLDHFRLSDKTLDEIRRLDSTFKLSLEAELRRKHKLRQWNDFGNIISDDNYGFLDQRDFDYMEKDLVLSPVAHDVKEIGTISEVTKNDIQYTKLKNKYIVWGEYCVLVKEVKTEYIIHIIRFTAIGEYVKPDQVIYTGE